MEVHSTKTKMKPKNIETYKTKMEEFDFMSEYFKDIPEIFNPNTMKCRLFLVKSFTILDANFHYLSLLSNDTIDQELLKAACILQIYPFRANQKTDELFHDMNDADLHKFWMKFFKLCEMHKAANGENSDSINIYDKHYQTLFCNINKTSHYFAYDISIINQKKIKDVDLDKEISSWNGMSLDKTVVSNIINVTQENNIGKSNFSLDINKLLCDVKYIKKKIGCRDVTVCKLLYFHEDFFLDFNFAVKEISTFKENVYFIGSAVLESVMNNVSLYTGHYFSLNTCQLKRCNNIIQNISGGKEIRNLEKQ